MSVSGKDVRHIAALARLEIADERIDTLVTELNGILVHMDVLQALDLGVSAPANAAAEAAVSHARPSVLREDTPGSVPLHHERDTFAPAFRDGFFLVPRLSTHE